MPPIVNGLLFGLFFVLAIGPAFFALIQTSMQRGFQSALFFAIGISISDTFYVILAILGLSELLNEPRIEMLMGTMAMLLLTVAGVYYWRKRPSLDVELEENGDHLSKAKYVLKGLVLNGFNPFIIVFWLTLISFVNVNYEYGQQEVTLFFVGVLITIFVSDLVKAFAANRLKYMITPKIVANLNRVVGAVLIIFSLRIFHFLLFTYWIQ